MYLASSGAAPTSLARVFPERKDTLSSWRKKWSWANTSRLSKRYAVNVHFHALRRDIAGAVRDCGKRIRCEAQQLLFTENWWGVEC